MTTKRWYAEAIAFDGKLKPCIVHGAKPSAATDKNKKKGYHNVKEIPVGLAGCSVEELYKHFNEGGKGGTKFRTVRE